MKNGYIVLFVDSIHKSPLYLVANNNADSICSSTYIDHAAIFPVYEAAEVAANALLQESDVLYATVLCQDGTACEQEFGEVRKKENMTRRLNADNTDGKSPCSYDERVNERISDRTRYINRTASKDEIF